jgi:hypothetical protein
MVTLFTFCLSEGTGFFPAEDAATGRHLGVGAALARL